MRTTLLLIAPILTVFPLLAIAADVPPVKITQGEKVLEVQIGGKPFTTYHFADDLVRPFVRPFFWPVRTADGVEVTSDQLQAKDAKGKPADHPHHRSIWVAHGDVNGIDHWSFQQKPAPPKQRHVRFDKVDVDGFVESLIWDDLAGQPLLTEARTVRFIAYADGARGIDVTVALTAASAEVTLGDTKEAGLCAVRVAKQISDKPMLINSAGGRATNAKEEAAQIWGKPADWCDESGSIDGRPYGIAIFDHPTNPRHPTTWHARTYGLVAPNEFGLHDFDKTQPTGAGDFKIANGQSATFRYRVILHEGDASVANVGEKYKEFATEK
jgi:hypothetical protein